jgi:predicted amidohydrolase
MSTAAMHDVSLLVFPELSLTGYEPELAADLAITPMDRRLRPLLALARERRIEAVVGVPVRDGPGKPKLGALVIVSTIRAYYKMHLGGDEPVYFEAGDSPLLLNVGRYDVGLAICADSSRATHPETYARFGAKIYAAAVFLTGEWYQTDVPRLARYSKYHRLLTVMANHAASVGSYESVGKSAVWTPEGEILVQAAGTENVLLIAGDNDGVWRGEVIAP